jgi:hypothetical protein
MAEEGPTTSPAPRRKPQIGDSIPAKVVAERSPGGAEPPSEGGSGEANKSPNRRRRPRNSGTGGAHNQPSDAPAAESGGQDSASQVSDDGASGSGSGSSGAPKRRRRRRGGKGKGGGGGPSATPIEAVLTDDGDPIELDEATLASRRGPPPQRTGRRSVPNEHPRHGRGHPRRRDGGSSADRALRLPQGRRRLPDPRQHLHGPRRERVARHGGGVRRHLHAQERRGLSQRRHRARGPEQSGRHASKRCSRPGSSSCAR